MISMHCRGIGAFISHARHRFDMATSKQMFCMRPLPVTVMPLTVSSRFSRAKSTCTGSQGSTGRTSSDQLGQIGLLCAPFPPLIHIFSYRTMICTRIFLAFIPRRCHLILQYGTDSNLQSTKLNFLSRRPRIVWPSHNHVCQNRVWSSLQRLRSTTQTGKLPVLMSNPTMCG